MSVRFTAVKPGGRPLGAYPQYLLAALEQVLVRTLSAADTTATYAGYVAEPGAESWWLGRQAALWGLTGQPVTVEQLTAMMDHRDPVSGVDLDSGRQARMDRWVENAEASHAKKVRWDAQKVSSAERAAVWEELATDLEGLAEAPARMAARLNTARADLGSDHRAMAVAASRALAEGRNVAAAVRAVAADRCRPSLYDQAAAYTAFIDDVERSGVTDPEVVLASAAFAKLARLLNDRKGRQVAALEKAIRASAGVPQSQAGDGEKSGRRDRSGRVRTAKPGGTPLVHAIRVCQSRAKLAAPVVPRAYDDWLRKVAAWDSDPSLEAGAAVFDRLAAIVDVPDRDLDDAIEAALLVLDELADAPDGPLTVGRIADLRALFADDDDSLVRSLRAYQRGAGFFRPADDSPAPAMPTREISAYDATVGVAQSVSILALLADDRTREAVLGVARDALSVAFEDFLQNDAIALSKGTGRGGGHEDAVGMAIAAVMHKTARPSGDPPRSDPQLHWHMAINSLAQSLEGEWKNFDALEMYRVTGVLNRLFTQELQAGLTAKLGVEWRERVTVDPVTGRESSHQEIDFAGMTIAEQDGLIDHFSGRQNDIAAYVAEQRAAGKTVTKEMAWAATRNPKDEPALDGALLDEWRARLAGQGVRWEDLGELTCDRAPEQLRAEVRQAQFAAADLRRRTESTERSEESMRWAAAETVDVAEIADALAAGENAYSRTELLNAALAAAPPTMSGQQVWARVNAYLTHVAPLVTRTLEDDPLGWTAGRWTTSEHWGREASVIADGTTLLEDRAAGAAVTAEVAEKVLRDFAAGDNPIIFDEMQLRMIFAATRDEAGGRLFGVVAPAGAGKSAAMKAIVDMWRLQHGDRAQVFAVSLASKAGLGLAAELTDLPDLAGSIDLLLAAINLGKVKLTAETLIVLDEAAMASSSKMGAVLAAAARVPGCRVVIAGDPMQLDSPGSAGGLLRWLDKAEGATVTFSSTRRHADPEVREQQLAWHKAMDEGDTQAAGKVLDFYAARGDISVAAGSDAARAEVVAGYIALREEAAVRAAEWDAKRAAFDVRLADVRRQLRSRTTDKAALQAERAALEAERAAHIADRRKLVRDDIGIVAYRQADVALLSDSIQAYQTLVGEIDDSKVVEGRRWAAAPEYDFEGREYRWETAVPVVDDTGQDISVTRLAVGLTVRLTANGRDGVIAERLAAAINETNAERHGPEVSRRARWDAHWDRKEAARAVELIDAGVPPATATANARSWRQQAAGTYVPSDRFRATEAWRNPQVRDLSDALGADGARFYNGQLGVVEAVSPKDGTVTVLVEQPDGSTRRVGFSGEQLQAGVLVPAAGKTLTVHASQGMTWDCGLLCVDDAASASLAYVGMTRARHDMRMVYAGAIDEHGELLENPAMAAWRHRAALAEAAGEEFTSPEPTELVPGLSQLRSKVWLDIGASTLAHQRATEAKVVTPDDRDAARRSYIQLGVDPATVGEDVLAARAEVERDLRLATSARKRAERERRLGELTARESPQLGVS